MYFLQKFCRICIRTDVALVDISMVDFDSVRLSDKLKICTNLVITQRSISSDICQRCVDKLRISYDFQNMCDKSTKVIRGYLEKLTKVEGIDETNSKFEQCELNVFIEHLPETKVKDTGHVEDNEEFLMDTVINLSNSVVNGSSVCKRKQRITKQQRCSLLKQLLTPGSKPKKERDKHMYYNNIYNYEKGGLKNIIDFTKNYEFSFKLDKNSNIESTPLDKLTAFSTNFFQRDFSEFKNHILYVIENRDRFENNSTCSTDDEDCPIDTDDTDLMGTKEMNFEEVIVEPDIKIKSEIMDCEEEESNCPLDYLETSFEEEDTEIKKEETHSDLVHKEMDHLVSHIPNFFDYSLHLNGKMSLVKQQYNFQTNNRDILERSINSNLNHDSAPSMKLLDKLVSNYPLSSRKVFSPNNVRCRTRNNPYINPMLKDQFLFRSFKCERCNRYFKSQGYLKAHASKVH